MELSLTVSVITVSLVYRALCVRVSLINLSVTVSFTVSVSVVTTDVMCISFTDHIATDGCQASLSVWYVVHCSCGFY